MASIELNNNIEWLFTQEKPLNLTKIWVKISRPRLTKFTGTSMLTARGCCLPLKIAACAWAENYLRWFTRTRSIALLLLAVLTWTSDTILSSQSLIEGERQKICLSKIANNRNCLSILEVKVVLWAVWLMRRTIWCKSCLGLRIMEKNIRNSS